LFETFLRRSGESVDGLLAKSVDLVYPPEPEEATLMSMNPSTHTFEPKAAQAATAMPCGSRRIAVRRFDVTVALSGRRAR
jgi:hypothetical protein